MCCMALQIYNFKQQANVTRFGFYLADYKAVNRKKAVIFIFSMERTFIIQQNSVTLQRKIYMIFCAYSSVG
ncbi:hypothetical protein D9M68_543690 [compost metagenome]